MADTSYLQWLSGSTETAWWHDSGDPRELRLALVHGAVGVTTNPVLCAQALKNNAELWRDDIRGVLRVEQAPAARAESLMRIVVVNAARIRVTGIEARLNTRYTADTLHSLQTRFPHTRFVWIMGADNLTQIPRWERWTEIFRSVPIAVFDRATYSFRALAGKAARRFARRRIDSRNAVMLAERKPPAWVYFHVRRHPASATSIRALASQRMHALPRARG